MFALNKVMQYPRNVICQLIPLQTKRETETVRQLLQMRSCRKLKDTSVEASQNRDALTEKFYLEKETGDVV